MGWCWTTSTQQHPFHKGDGALNLTLAPQQALPSLTAVIQLNGCEPAWKSEGMLMSCVAKTRRNKLYREFVLLFFSPLPKFNSSELHISLRLLNKQFTV